MSAQVIVVENEDYPLVIEDRPTGSLFVYFDRKVECDYSALEWLSKECLKFGSTLNGRKEAFRYLTKTKQKPAILLSERYRLLYFPCKADSNHDNIWINDSQLIDFKKLDECQTKLLFTHDFVYTIPFAYRTIKKQSNNCYTFQKLIFF